MIYINSDTNWIQIPKHIYYEGENSYPISLKLENNVTHQTHLFSDLTNRSLKSNIYEFEVSIDVPVGEYSYNLLIDEAVVERGLLVFGDYKTSTKNYKSNTNTIQYRK